MTAQMTTLHANFNLANAAPKLMSAQGNASTPVSTSTLADVAIGEQWIVRQVIAPKGAPEWLMQLEDIGFIAGEPVALMARGAFGGDPVVVRIGVSTFALRLAEAACVQVQAIPSVVTV